MADVQGGKFGTDGVLDLYGQPTQNLTAAKGLTLHACETYCGKDRSHFEWYTFSQEFSSWLLPWLALSAQLPFGATSRLDNALAWLLSIGSPALAVYSLTLTLLQRRWIRWRFSDIARRLPNGENIRNVMLALEQMPLRIAETGPDGDGVVESLVALPDNDVWWERLASRVQENSMWTIPAAVSIFWTVLALVFTLVDSTTSPDIDISSHGHAVGAVLLWLIPVVAGWMQAGFQTNPSRVARIVEELNNHALVASPYVTPDGRDDPVPVRHSIIHDAIAIDVRKRHDSDSPAPIFAYARLPRLSAQMEHIALVCEGLCDRLMMHKPVAFARRHWSFNLADNRRGIREEIIAACSTPLRSIWAPGVWARIAFAAAIACAMQWFTTGAAIYITYLTPTVGLGCRSGSFLAYGIGGTFAWLLLLLSSVLSHLKDSEFKRSRTRHILEAVCITLDVTAKLVATANAIWIITLCIFQFSGFYSTCYCMSAAWELKERAHDMFVSWPDLVELGTRTVWVSGIVSTGVVAFVYSAFVYFALSPDE